MVLRTWPPGGSEHCHAAVIYVLAVGRQYFMPFFVAVAVEAVVVSACL